MRIRAVRGLAVEVPLRRPVTVGGITSLSRDYTLGIVETDAGLRGVGYGLAHTGEVAAVIERNLQPLLLGEDPLQTELLWERMYIGARHIGRKGTVMRAISAVDIALWDIKAQVAGLPLYRLLGGYRDTVPVLASGGYTPEDGVEALAEEMSGYVAAGHSMVKISVGALPPEEDLRRVQATRAAIGPHTKLIVDVNGAWRQAKPVIKLARQMADCGLAFIEEPFGPDYLPALKAFAAAVDTPLAVGEAESGRWAFRDLLVAGVVDALCHDATLVGGVSEWLKVTTMAAAWDVMILPHSSPELHIHLAAAVPNALAVEVISPQTGVVNLHELVENPVRPQFGLAVPPSVPGLGIQWNWDAIARYRKDR